MELWPLMLDKTMDGFFYSVSTIKVESANM